MQDSDLVRYRHQLGSFELTGCSDGTFKLDGGAMFGVVPKTLWQKRLPADADNRVLLGLNTCVVRTGSAVVVIETGLGNKQSPKMREILENHEQLPQSLAAAAVDAAEVTHVVNTHLHFDHCGWNTTLRPDGSITPTFPNARYFCAAGEVAHGRLQLDRDKVSYLGVNYDPLINTGQLTQLDGDAQIAPGVWTERFPGHTANLRAVHVACGDAHACFCGDLFPTSHHLEPTWVMGYDLDPLTCIEQRKIFLRRAIEERWLVLFPHDHQVPGAFLYWNEKGKPVAVPAF